MRNSALENTSLALAALLAVPLALPPLLGEAFFMFRTPAGMRTLVCLPELAFVAAWLAARPPGRLPAPAGPAALAAGLWLILSTVSVAAADYPVPALVRHAEWACHVLFALTLADALVHRPALAGVGLGSVAGGFVVVTAGMAVFWTGLPAPAAYDWGLDPPFFSHIRHYGYFALAALMACTYPIVGRTRGPWLAAAVTAFALALAAIFWTGGRGAAFGALAGLSVMAVRVGGRARIRLLAVAATVLPAVWLAARFPVDVPIMGLERMLGGPVATQGFNELSTGRGEVWRYTAAAIGEHPLLGLGPDGFAYLSPPVMKLPVQPHSMPLQLASDWGLPAAAGFGVLLLLGGLRWWRLSSPGAGTEPDRAAAGGLIVALTVHGAVDGTYYHAVPLAILASAFAIALRPRAAQSSAPARGGIRAGAVAGTVAIAGAVMLLHTAVVVVVSRPGVPDPQSLSARLVHAFPSRINQYTLRPWLEHWQRDRPAVALDWARWAQRNARHPWWYHYYEASRLADRDAAAAAFGTAIHHAPGAEVDRLRAEYRARFGAGPSGSGFSRDNRG